MYYNKKHKILFIHNQKCAGRSIKIFLRKTFGKEIMPENSNHWSLNQLDYYLDDDLNDYSKITSVRNPWDRVVSYYYNAKKNNPDLYWLKSFGTFCSKADLKPLTLQNKICIAGEIKMDFCLRVENIEEDIDNLMNKMSVKNYPKIGKENHNTIRKKNYKDCYTISTRNIIAEVFAWEIKKFNYKF
jgi:hypothetical protein